MYTGDTLSGGNPVTHWHPIQGKIGISVGDSCYRNQVKLLPCGFHCLGAPPPYLPENVPNVPFGDILYSLIVKNQSAWVS